MHNALSVKNTKKFCSFITTVSRSRQIHYIASWHQTVPSSWLKHKLSSYYIFFPDCDCICLTGWWIDKRTRQVEKYVQGLHRWVAILGSQRGIASQAPSLALQPRILWLWLVTNGRRSSTCWLAAVNMTFGRIYTGLEEQQKAFDRICGICRRSRIALRPR
jgi:hypothetical protein